MCTRERASEQASERASERERMRECELIAVAFGGNVISGCVTQGKSLNLSESQWIVVKVKRASLLVFCRLY